MEGKFAARRVNVIVFCAAGKVLRMKFMRVVRFNEDEQYEENVDDQRVQTNDTPV